MKVKYPRTFHLPYSATITDDDKRLESDSHFNLFEEVVVTEKMDGENTTVYQNGDIHARSIDGNSNPWQTWLKSYVRNWCFNIPDGWRVCGENLYPRHSIPYVFTDDSEFFQLFGIYDDSNRCLSWDETIEYANLLGIKTVNAFYRGKYDKNAILAAFEEYKRNSANEVEGFVVRNSASFLYSEFKLNVGKYVRANHVTTDEHWTRNWVPNEIFSENPHWHPFR